MLKKKEKKPSNICINLVMISIYVFIAPLVSFYPSHPTPFSTANAGSTTKIVGRV
jgi:hypothetical protein